MKTIEIVDENLIKQEYKQLDDYINSISNKNFTTEYNRVSKLRDICPFCGAGNPITDFKNVNGKIKGEVHGDFFLGFGSVNGYIDGYTKTDKVFQCRKCQNFWKDEEMKYDGDGNILEDLLHSFYFYMDAVKDVDFDPSNPEEKFSSKEKKLADKIRRNEERYFKPQSIIRNFHPESIKWVIKNNEWSMDYKFYREIKNWSKEIFYEWGCKKWPTKIKYNWFEKLILRKK